MNDEKCEHADQQQVHEQPYEIERRVQLAIVRVCVRLVLNEAFVRTFMALAARHDEVCLVDGRTWIGGAVDFMCVVTIPAACGFHVPAQ